MRLTTSEGAFDPERLVTFVAGREPLFRPGRAWAYSGSGPMWSEYLARDLIEEVPRLPAPMLIIAGAPDMNTPVRLVTDWMRRSNRTNHRLHHYRAPGNRISVTSARKNGK